jgi:hypothetical protein
MNPEVGDKVKLKSHHGTPVRGIVEAVHGDELLIRLHESGELIALGSESVTNFSLAARKAWENMPDRHVGRPRGTRHCDRISVTLRIDRELWEQFKRGESEGRIRDRTATINFWFRTMLDKLERTRDCRDAAEDQ